MEVMTYDAIMGLMKKDMEQVEDGGDSDLEGNGEFVLDAFNSMMIECRRKKNIHDCNMIDDNILDSKENGIVPQSPVKTTNDNKAPNNDDGKDAWHFSCLILHPNGLQQSHHDPFMKRTRLIHQKASLISSQLTIPADVATTLSRPTSLSVDPQEPTRSI